jgi:hypothetical protein
VWHVWWKFSVACVYFRYFRLASLALSLCVIVRHYRVQL